MSSPGPDIASLLSQYQAFYSKVFPVDDITDWISYNLPVAGDDEGKARERTHKSRSYLANREFCFTFIGDIFSRYRSFSSSDQLRNELSKRGPEKIDIGAVYDMPAEKKVMTTITAQDRELVFDIDMSDYDHIRSCCKGKKVCRFCWPWMACAARVLAHILREDFGFKYMMPVFSGRRGIHLWVCDRRARELSDEERAAIVGYMSVVVGESKTVLGGDLVRGKAVHPTMQYVAKTFLEPYFARIFSGPDESNPNHMANPASASVVFGALAAAMADGWRTKELGKVTAPTESTGLKAAVLEAQLERAGVSGALVAAQFALLYPRLDVNVSTRKDHLLKLPFCVHPGTGRLCCPLNWAVLDDFDPVADPPAIGDMLASGIIENRWKLPLSEMLQEMAEDPKEQRTL